MIYRPLVESMDGLGGCPLGERHVGVLFGNIKAAGRMQYEYLFLVCEKDTAETVMIVSSEKNSMRSQTGCGSHFLGAFDERGHTNLGNADNWGDRATFFRKALELAELRLNLRPSGESTPAG